MNKKERKEIMKIIAYSDGAVALYQEGKLIPVTSIKFEADCESVPILSITQLIVDRGD